MKRMREKDGETKMGMIKYAVIRDACLSLVLAVCRYHSISRWCVRRGASAGIYVRAFWRRKKLNGILPYDILSGNKKKLGYINMMDGNSKSIKHVLCWDGSADNNYIWRIVVCGECNMSLLLNAENWRNKKLNCYYKIMYSDNSHLYALAFISRRTHKKK